MSLAFSQPKLISRPSPSAVLAVGDLNGDGNVDLVIDQQRNRQTQIVVLAGNGRGGFRQTSATTIGSDQVADLLTADLNRDGKLDLVVRTVANFDNPNPGKPATLLLLNDGRGNLTAPTPVAPDLNPRAVATADFNGDGLLDLAVAELSDSYYTPASSRISIVLNSPTGFVSGPKLTVQGQSTAVTTGDFNGDGKLDIAAAGLACGYAGGNCRYSDGQVSVLLGDGTGNFAAAIDSPSGGGGRTGIYSGENDSIITADFNGDGKLDVAVGGRYYTEPAAILLGDGRGNLKLSASSDDAVSNSSRLAVADFNADGQPDLAATGAGFMSRPQGLVALGSGIGQISRFKGFGSLARTEFLGAVATADFNRDGRPDLAALASKSSNRPTPLGVTIWLNQTQGQNAFLQIGNGLDASSQRGGIAVNLAEGTLRRGRRQSSVEQIDLEQINQVIGTRQRDQITGNQRANLLQGIDGADQLLGLEGNDTLIGGNGNDRLTGGAGSDRFLFSSRRAISRRGGLFLYDLEIPFSRSLGVDQITDFQPNADKISLDRSTFARFDSLLRVPFAAVRTVAQAERSNALIAYIARTGSLYYNENRSESGFGSGGLFAQLTPGLNLTPKNFVV